MNEICDPLLTPYGWWVLKLIETKDAGVPELDEAHRERIAQAVAADRTNQRRQAFMAESRARHGFSMNDDALWVIYEGLPEPEALIDPGTRQPLSRDELTPLQIPEDKLGMVFFTLQPDLEAEAQTITVGTSRTPTTR